MARKARAAIPAYRRKRKGSALGRVLGWIGRLITPGEPAPYGVAIALGALIAFPASQLIRFLHTSY